MIVNRRGMWSATHEITTSRSIRPLTACPPLPNIVSSLQGSVRQCGHENC